MIVKVRALISFVGRDGSGKKHIIDVGDELELPAGTDWLDVGFVEPVEAETKKAAPKRSTRSKKVNGG